LLNFLKLQKTMKNLIQKKWMILFISFYLIFSSNTLASNYVVSGAGSTDCNGKYVETGTQNGKPYYVLTKTNGPNFAICWNRSRWVIGEEMMPGFIMDEYYINRSTANECPSAGWEEYMGRSPIPTVGMEGKSLTYSSTTFREDKMDTGTMCTVITITHNNYGSDAFTGSDDENFITTGKVTVSNVPAGLTASIVRKSNLTLEFKLIGNATNHTNANDISNLTVAFQNGAFTGNSASEVSNSNLNNLSVDFIQIHTVASSGGDYTTLLAARDAADDYDIISIAAQVFTEKFSANKNLTIKGQGANVSIIQADATPNTATGRVITSSGTDITVRLEDLTIRNGRETSNGYGGGISVAGNLFIDRCAIINNTTSKSYMVGGGGIFAANLDIRNSYIAGNKSSNSNYGSNNEGGGIYATKLFMLNCTVANNLVTSTSPSETCMCGGIYANNATIINSTITGNSAYKCGAIAMYGGTIKNSILWGNTATNKPTVNLEINNSVSAYNSIIENAPTITVSENITNVNPLMNAAADNGGQTFTCALQAGSPAINAGATGTDTPFADQRGLFANGIRDIGAYELNGLLPPQLSVKQASTTIADGTGTYDFGRKNASTDTDIVFSIENTGEAASSLGNFSITGINANQFSIQGSAPTTVAAGASVNFTVRFLPNSAGEKNAEISFENQDANESPYNFSLKGTGIDVGTILRNPNEITLQILPNPARNQFQINGLTSQAEITITDMTGKVCKKARILSTSIIPIDNLSNGMYIVQINSENKSIKLKLLKD